MHLMLLDLLLVLSGERYFVFLQTVDIYLVLHLQGSQKFFLRVNFAL